MARSARDSTNRVLRYADVARAIGEAGLVARGGFHCRPDDAVPSAKNGAAAASLVLVGTAGSEGFSAFRASAEARDGRADPLDRFSERVVSALAAVLGGWALFPFRGPPWLPFQRWAMRAEPVRPSPLGSLIHPHHGLWHAYRGALAFARRVDAVPRRSPAAHPCDSCRERPCLAACPVSAFATGRFAADACGAHVAGPAGSHCVDAGCLARAACPVGRSARYALDQRRFHMRAFAAALARSR